MARLVAYGNKQIAHWGQGQCEHCAAWLKPMADRHEQHASGTGWDYFFVCVACGTPHRQPDSTPPERWAEDPDVTSHEPGTRPPEPVRDPDRWREAKRLSPDEKSLVRDCWAMVDALREWVIIHQITYVWAIEEALVAEDVAALVAAAVEYVNLLDYEAIHGKWIGTYNGDEGDVTAIRADLDHIPMTRRLRAGRASPWRPDY